MDIQTYDVDGGSTATVYKIYGNDKYFATVDIKGNYPRKNVWAKNRGRQEFVLILEGEVEFNLNGEIKTLKQNDSILVKDGDEYSLKGFAKVIVFVEDQEGGETDFFEIKQSENLDNENDK